MMSNDPTNKDASLTRSTCDARVQIPKPAHLKTGMAAGGMGMGGGGMGAGMGMAGGGMGAGMGMAAGMGAGMGAAGGYGGARGGYDEAAGYGAGRHPHNAPCFPFTWPSVESPCC